MGKILPLIDKECAIQLKGLTPKDKVTVAKFTHTMAQINEKILQKLFEPVDEAEADTINIVNVMA